jgi:hypothetical protein
LFVDRDLDAIPASGRATRYTPTSRVCHKTLPLSEFQRPKIDAADLVFAGGKLADVVGVVDELRPRITIGAVERRR